MAVGCEQVVNRNLTGMAAMIDLTETSSDEEDASPARRPSAPPPRAAPIAGPVNGVVRKFEVSEKANGGGRAAGNSPGVSASVVASNGGSTPLDRNGSSENGKLLAGAAWKGLRVGKNEASTPTEGVHPSGGLSGWGDPLPPDPSSRTPPAAAGTRRENGTVGTIPPLHAPTAVSAPVLTPTSIPTGASGATAPLRVPTSAPGAIAPLRVPTSAPGGASASLRVPTTAPGASASLRVPTTAPGASAALRIPPLSVPLGAPSVATPSVRGPVNQSSTDVVKREPGIAGREAERMERMKGKAPVLSSGAATSSAAAPPLNNSAPVAEKVCRQFWRAGDYEAKPNGVRTSHGAMDHVRVHPKFLHSNATSHKWALGAIAELLDNAVDEVENGATFVSLDKVINPKEKTSALLVQDDGGGMSPDTMRACMSLGYSRKNTNTTIGQYGNGFKTSTMRLGADVVVFSRHINKETKAETQSIGLLSYTFLRQTGREDVVVPMIDWEFSSGGLQRGDTPRRLIRSTDEDWMDNFSSVAEWSPYSSEADLLMQFDDIGLHGTKVIVYNLWDNEEGILEMDFESDPLDIQLRGGAKNDNKKPIQNQLSDNHIANLYQHSLRVYTSILYLKMPEGFQIVLRGVPVEHHSVASDLKFPESIVYKPQILDEKNATYKDKQVITIIGFTKEAPLINVHGFNVYHKNRLIMPFWKVWHDNSSRGRGVVGVLEANFVEPAHDKQDFERTAVLLRLETRLKQMTVEYWNLHCHLIGYQPNTKAGKARKQAATPTIEYPAPIASLGPEGIPRSLGGASGSMGVDRAGSRSPSPASEGPYVKSEPGEVLHNGGKRNSSGNKASEAMDRYKRQRTTSNSHMDVGPGGEAGGNTEGALVEQPYERDDAMIISMLEENTQLRSRCTDYELDVKKLESKVLQLEKELLDTKMKNVNLHEKNVTLEEQLHKVGHQTTSKQRTEVFCKPEV